MIIIKDMPLKCWDCFEHLDKLQLWRWRPAGYQGLVCDRCANAHLQRGTVMTRQYNWESCGFCDKGIPDHYMTCDNGHPIPMGHSFHLGCFTKANKAGELSCSCCGEKCRNPVPVAAVYFGEHQLIEDQKDDCYEDDEDEDEFLQVYEDTSSAGWEHNYMYFGVEDVLDVQYTILSRRVYTKKVLISWRAYLVQGDVALPITYHCWEYYLSLKRIWKAGHMEKADMLFKEKPGVGMIWGR